MAIARNAGGDQGKYIREKGEYKVTVIKTETGMSKSNKKMLTIHFQTADERSIRSFFVQSLPFHMKALKLLMQAAGDVKDVHLLIGKQVGINVEPQEPDPKTGRVFMQIVGYGPAADVSSNNYGAEGPPSDDFAPPFGDDNVPF